MAMLLKNVLIIAQKPSFSVPPDFYRDKKLKSLHKILDLNKGYINIIFKSQDNSIESNKSWH